MTVLITGEMPLYKKINSLYGVLRKSFWTEVQEDFEKNLVANVEPHNKPGGTGTLAKNVYVDIIPNGVEGGIRDDGMMVSWNGGRINYGQFVEHGTDDHDIPLKNKKALMWNTPFGRFFSKGHRVKGIKASHYLERAADKTFKNLDKIFKDELHKKGII